MNASRVAQYLTRHPNLHQAARVAGYSALIAYSSAFFSGFAGLVPSVSAGCAIADHYSQPKVPRPSLFKRLLKVFILTAGISSVFLANSSKVLSGYLLASGLAVAAARGMNRNKVNVKV